MKEEKFFLEEEVKLIIVARVARVGNVGLVFGLFLRQEVPPVASHEELVRGHVRGKVSLAAIELRPHNGQHAVTLRDHCWHPDEGIRGFLHEGKHLPPPPMTNHQSPS